MIAASLANQTKIIQLENSNAVIPLPPTGVGTPFSVGCTQRYTSAAQKIQKLHSQVVAI